MTLSSISLLRPDPDQLCKDKGAKSISFFCRRRPVRIDHALFAELRQVSISNGGKNVRVCLHDGPKARHHDMVILENRGKYYRPHKHRDKGEAFHVIEGRLGLFTFSDSGEVIDSCVLAPGEIYRVEENAYHAVLPMTKQVIYHENKPGPFTGEGDSIFPNWAPDGNDEIEQAAYSTSLRRHL